MNFIKKSLRDEGSRFKFDVNNRKQSMSQNLHNIILLKPIFAKSSAELLKYFYPKMLP